MTQGQDEVLAANRAFYDAFERLDAEALGRVWSDATTVTCIHPAWDLIEGRDEVLASYRKIFRNTRAITFRLDDLRVFVTGDTAWVILIEVIHAMHGEEQVTGTAQATNVFHREAAGWKLVHHHAAPVKIAEEPKKPPSQLN